METTAIPGNRSLHHYRFSQWSESKRTRESSNRGTYSVLFITLTSRRDHRSGLTDKEGGCPAAVVTALRRFVPLPARAQDVPEDRMGKT